MTQKKLLIANQVIREEARGIGNFSRQRETKEDYEENIKRLDQLEDAARRIQQSFRMKNSHQGIHTSVAKKSLCWDLDDIEESDRLSDTSENTSDNETSIGQKPCIGENEEGRMFTLFFIALGSLGMMAFSTFSCCFKKLFGNSTEDDVATGVTDFPNVSSTQHSVQQTASNAVQPATPVNGSSGVSPPQPGGVASMAASSAASSVAVGLSTGMSAAAATAGGLAGTLVATSTTQIIAAVTVAAAVGATVSSVGITTVSSGFPTMGSSCGVVDPDRRTGNFTLSLEGLQREIADREVFLFENLVVTAYNDLTRGSVDDVTGQYQCADRYLREMQQSSMIRQVYVGQDATPDGLSKLQIDLEAVILCKDCPAVLPIFGKIEEERMRRRNLRILEQKEVFDVSLIEAFLKTIVEALFELMNLGELPLSFAPSMVYFRPFQLGRYPELNATVGNNETFEVIIPVATYNNRIKEEIFPIFPTQTVNGELDVDFYKGHFEMAIAGFGLTRNFTDEETMLIEDLFVVAYNQQNSQTTNTSTIREMARAILANQVFTPGGNGTEATLDIAFKAFITCQGCPEDEPLFGELGDHDELDLDLIHGVLKDVVLGMIGLINSGDLPSSFVPDEVYYIDDESNSTDLVSIPVMTNVEANGTIVVDFPDVGQSVNGELDVDFYKGHFEMAIAGFGLTRNFTDEETMLIEDLFVVAYNQQNSQTTNTSTIREMARAILANQVFTPGGNGTEATLDIAFKAFITCQGCPEDEPLFGELGDHDELDLDLIHGVLKDVVLGMIGLINSGDLPSSFVPDEVYYIDDESNSTDLVSIPVMTNVEANGTIVVDFPDVGLSPQIYSDEFGVSFRGFAREFNEAESRRFAELLVQDYNAFIRGNEAISAHLREMFQPAITNQEFRAGDESTSSELDVTLGVSVICQDCPDNQLVFGLTNGEDGEGLLDWTFIEAVIPSVISSMVEDIRSGAFQSSFLPEGVVRTDDSAPPIVAYLDETTGQLVLEFVPPEPAAPSISMGPSISSSRSPSMEFPSESPSSRPTTSSEPSLKPSTSPTLSALPSESPTTKPPASTSPSYFPSAIPTSTEFPGQLLSNQPSGSSEPSIQPTLNPTLSSSPSELPSSKPTTSGQPSIQPSSNPTSSSSPSELPSSKPTISGQPSIQPSSNPTVSSSPSGSPSNKPTISGQPSIQPSASPSLSMIPSSSPSTTPSISREPSLGPTGFPSETPSNRPSHSAEPSILPSATPSTSALPSVLPSVVPTISREPTQTPTVRASRVPTMIPSVSPTAIPTNSPTSRPTPTPSSAPTAVPTNAPTQTPSESPSAVPTSAPTSSPTSEPSETPSLDPTSEPTTSPTLAPTSEPTRSPTMAPTETLSVDPTLAPTKFPTITPTSEPTPSPTMAPTATPSFDPTSAPTRFPTVAPTSQPTRSPTIAPTETPSLVPSLAPTRFPTLAPTSEPTRSPTIAPTEALSGDPTLAPTRFPTVAPTSEPTRSPTIAPTETPSLVPTLAPTRFPTLAPTSEPTRSPTLTPTQTPSLVPTLAPTEFPTESPTGSSAQMPSSTPSVTEGRWTVCGAHKNFQNSCAGIESEVTPADVTVVNGSPLVVRCCSTEASPGFEKRKGGGISRDCPYTASELGGTCYENVDYLTAESICADANGRLCTAAELADGCATGSGCEFDTRRVWTSDTADVVVPR